MELLNEHFKCKYPFSFHKQIREFIEYLKIRFSSRVFQIFRFMETERDFIKRHKTLEKEIENLSLERSYSTKQNEIDALDLHLAELNAEKAKVELALSDSRDTSATKRKRANLIDELREIIDHLKISDAGHRISRNQGLIIDNFIFGKIIWDISRTFESEVSYPIPNYYFEIGGDFDHKPLKDFLVRKLKELESKDANSLSYVDLKDWVESLKEQIRSFWQMENSRTKISVKR